MKSDISAQLVTLAAALKVRFTYNNKMLSHEEVFSPMGLLPAIAKRADQISSLCLGYGIGVTFEDAEKAMLGREAKFDEETPTVLRLMCLMDTLQELIKTSPNKELIPLDELMYD
jgi:intracellular multiplication protein IcmS